MASRGSLLAWTLCAALASGAGSGPASADPVARGAELFELCAQCHGENGEGNQAFLAPAIAGLPAWYVAAQLESFRSGLRGTHPEDVAGLRMYPMSLSLKYEGDIEAVSAHLAGLPPVAPEPVLEGGDPRRGAQLYAPCTACHGPDGAGMEALKAPRLTFASDWYLLSTLQKYKSGVRGSDPRNVNAALMRGMAQALPDEQAMKDVIAHIETLAAPAAR
jgi:cytochrome c553